MGKQTIYRWWPSKSAVLLEAMIERAKTVAPVRDTGDLRDDLYLLLRSTFATDMAVDQVFGHQPLNAQAAGQLANAVVTQLTTARASAANNRISLR